MGDNPDWTLPVSVRAQEIESLAVDIAAQSLSELTIKIAGQEVPVTIEPAGGVVFNVQGSVDANITNSSLNVHVTNSSLTVTVQGTANVEIQNAQLNVQTLREQASEAGKVTYASKQLDLYNNSQASATLYQNTSSKTVFLEAIYAALEGTSTYDQSCLIHIAIHDNNNNEVAVIPANPPNFPLNFDPAIPLPPGYKIVVLAWRVSSYQYTVYISTLLRTS